MVGKRGQITFFIITGLVILLAVGFFIAISSLKREPLKTQLEVQNQELEDQDQIQYYLDSCFENVAYESLMRMTFYGGFVDYTKVPIDYRDNTISINTVIFLYDGNKNPPYPPILPIIGSNFDVDSYKQIISQGIKEYIMNGMNGLSDSNLVIPDAPSRYEEHGFGTCIDPKKDGIPFDDITSLGWKYRFKGGANNYPAAVEMYDNSTVFRINLTDIEFYKDNLTITSKNAIVTYKIPMSLILKAAANIVMETARADLDPVDKIIHDSNIITTDIDDTLKINHYPFGDGKTQGWVIEQKYPSELSEYKFVFFTRTR